MKPLPFFAVASQQVATHSVKVLKLEATLNVNAAAGLYLQIHDADVAPANGAVPLKSWPAIECGYKEFELGEIYVGAGLYVALSTTAATLTLATGGSNILDILQIELVSAEVPTGTSIAGDLVTGVNSLQVWPDAAGPKKLLRIEVDNSGGGAKYLMLFAGDSPQAGDKPIDQFTIAASGTKTGGSAMMFGPSGRDVFAIDSAGAAHNGCTLMLSTTTGVLTADATATTMLRAEYK